jgi:hypothetical protein
MPLHQGPELEVPSMTRVRIPVRPQQRVWYAVWNNKRSLRVGRSRIAECHPGGSSSEGLGCFGSTQRVVLPVAPWKGREHGAASQRLAVRRLA